MRSVCMECVYVCVCVCVSEHLGCVYGCAYGYVGGVCKKCVYIWSVFMCVCV